MADVTAARLLCSFIGQVTPGSPLSGGPILGALDNGASGEFWTDGRGSKQIDRIYRADVSLGLGGSTSYNLLAAGGLLDINNRTIDLDELKVLFIYCLTGTIAFTAPAADFLPCFGATGDKIKLSAGQYLALCFGAGGLSLGTSGKFDIVEPGTAAATYSIAIAGAN